MMRFLAVLVALLLPSIPAAAQVATGTYAFGAFDNRGFDTVNVGNLNVHFGVPIINKSGRGLPFYYNLSYDSSVWYPSSTSGSGTWMPVTNFGWRGDTEVALGYLTYNDVSGTRGSGTSACDYEKTSNWVYHDAMGVAHSFAGAATQYNSSGGGGLGGNPNVSGRSGSAVSNSAPPGGSCPNSSPSFNSIARDRSGYTLAVTDLFTAVLTSPSGNVIDAPVSDYGGGVVTDANGNQVSTDGNGNFTDTTGKVVLQVAGNAPNPQTFTYTDTTGASRAVAVNYKTYTVQTNFGCSGIGEQGATSTSLVDTISLPDDQPSHPDAYHFSYETTPGYPNSVTGRLASVTLPGGGVIGYAYTGANNGIVCADGSAAGLTRTMLSDSPNTAWTYTRTPATNTSHTDVVDGLGNHLNYDFVAATVPGGAQQLGAYLYEVNRNAWNGTVSGTAVLAKATCYNGSSTPCTTTAIALPVAQIDTYQSLDGGGLSGSTTKYNAYGGPTEIDAYAFGSSSSRGSLLSQETLGYGACGPANLLSSDLVTDGTNTLSSKSFCYDQTAVTATSNLPSHAAAPGSRGNLTTSSKWLNTANSNVTSAFTYDDAGQILTAVDGRGNTISYTNDTATDAFPLKTTYPTPSSNAAMATSAQYDAMTGLASSVTDFNGQITSMKSYDALLRPTEIDYPDGGVTTYAYTPTEVTASRLRTGTTSYIVSVADTDGYGRQSKTTLKDATDGDAFVTYTYDGNGNTATVTNPHRSGGNTTDGTTTYAYDVLGRQTGLTHPDSTARSWTYSGNTVVVKDEGGSQWKQTSDALGRLTQVLEPSSTSKSPTLETDYGYSNLMLSVTQRGIVGQDTARIRIFTSDTLGRTVTEYTPEAGTVCYGAWSNGSVNNGNCVNGYDGNGNLLVKTDARNVAHTFQYDTLNRVIHEGSSDNTIANTYTYDWSGDGSFGKGLLYGVFGKSSTGLYYDRMGRITGKAYSLPSMNGNWAQAFTATYDYAGDLTSLTYPDGRVVNQSWNNAAHLQNVVFDNWNGQHVGYTYASGFTYTPAGAQAEVTVGNGVYTHTPYNNRQQLCQLWVYNGTQVLGDKHYMYGDSSQYCASTPGNNGNVSQLLDMKNGDRSQVFGYDPLNRLASFGTGGQSYNQTYSYDSFGNMNQVAPGTAQSNLSFNANNQIGGTGFAYDAAGNLTQTNVGAGVYQTMAYDAAGRLLNFNNGAGKYTYDAEGNRARKDAASDWREYLYFNGAVYAEKNSDGTWSDYIYANGQKIARADNFDARLHTSGHTTGGQGVGWALPQPTYTAHAGDVLVWRQLQTGGAYGGPNLQFSSAQTHEAAKDTAGVLVDVMQTQNVWVSRVAALDAYVGKGPLTGVQAILDPSTPSTNYDIYYGDMAIVAKDGTVFPLIGRQTSGTFTATWNTGGQPNQRAAMESATGFGASPGLDTTYFQGDHLGSARMLTAAGGWPVSSTTFYPFGVEEPGAGDTNHFRYASLERDAESGLDSATFRQLSSAQGRWLTPDPYDGSYDLSNPQSLNRYAYVLNNPMGFIDPSGLTPITGIVVCEPSYAYHATATIYYNEAPPAGSSPSIYQNDPRVSCHVEPNPYSDPQATNNNNSGSNSGGNTGGTPNPAPSKPKPPCNGCSADPNVTVYCNEGGCFSPDAPAPSNKYLTCVGQATIYGAVGGLGKGLVQALMTEGVSIFPSIMQGAGAGLFAGAAKCAF